MSNPCRLRELAHRLSRRPPSLVVCLVLALVPAGARSASRIELGAYGLAATDTDMGIGCRVAVRLGGLTRWAVNFSAETYFPSPVDFSQIAVGPTLDVVRLGKVRLYGGASLRYARLAIDRLGHEGYPVEPGIRPGRIVDDRLGAGLLFGVRSGHVFAEGRFEFGGGRQLISSIGLVF
jgi:hypothetical protein